MTKPTRSRGRLQQNLDLEERVMRRIVDDPTTSTRRIAAEEGVSKSIVWQILKDNELHPYHYQRVQALEEGDHERRRNFCSWMEEKIRTDESFLSRILFTDDASFNRHKIFNFHNSYVWNEENPHATLAINTQRQFSLNIWAGILGNDLIGPIVLPNRWTGQVKDTWTF
nr:PREDICTED: uncharacterized protein LOC105663164 [Megachile rotundata]